MGNKQSGTTASSDGAGTGRRASAAASARTPLDAIATTKEAQQTLDKKIDHIERQIQAERMAAKKLLMEKTNQAANKKRAQRHLLKARTLQSQIDKFRGMQDNLDNVQNNLELGAIAKNTFTALNTGNAAMKDMSKALDVEKMDDLMGDLTEGMQTMEEATNLMSQPIGSDPLLDEEAENDLNELMDELNMEEEEEEVPAVKTKKPAPKLPTAPTVSLPKAPTGRIKTAEEEEEDELAQLAKSMN